MRYNTWLKKNSDIGILLLRLFIGIRLVYGVADNVLSWQQMIHFSNFLENFGYPFPVICAVVSVYAQLIAGLMIIAGWKLRLAAAIMIIHFLVAIITVHFNDGFEQMTLALAILFSCLLFLFQGGGRFAAGAQKANAA